MFIFGVYSPEMKGLEQEMSGHMRPFVEESIWAGTMSAFVIRFDQGHITE